MDDDDLAGDIAATINELSGEGGAPAPSPAPEPSPAPAPGPAPAPASGAQRDATGRFVSKQEDVGAAAPTPPAPAPAAPAPAPTSLSSPPTTPAQSTAPISWKPQLREKWATLDPEVRLEISRREREIDSGLRAAAEHKRFSEEVNRALAPYAQILQQENASPVQAIASLFQTAAVLRTAQPHVKAQLVADMIMQFGVDVNALDHALSGRVQQTANPQFQQQQMLSQLLDQRLQPIQQFLGQFQEMRAQSETRTAEQLRGDLEAFASAPENEFFEHVREDMADILEAAARRGTQMSLQDAYKRATLAHPQIADILSQRALAQSASQQTAAAQRSRNASASLPSGGAPSQAREEDEGDDVRSAIQASIRQLSSTSR